MKTIIMLPTYNEAENIGNLINEIKNLKIPNLEILVVDDYSPDGTWKIVESMVNSDKRLHLLLRKTNKGRGAAGVAGFKKALDLGADVVCEMDADFSHEPKSLPSLLGALKSADMILGSRAVSGGRDDDRPWFRRIITKLANFYVSLLLGMKVKDCNSGYRCFKRKVLESIDLDTINSKGPAIVQEILYKVYLKGFKIQEVPISFIERKLGNSKFGMRHLYKGYILILKFKILHLFKKI